MTRVLAPFAFLAAAISCANAVKTKVGQAAALQESAAKEVSALDQLRSVPHQLPMRMMGVAALLKKFQESVELDKKEDANATAELRSWCEDNKKTKGDAILDGRADVKRLSSQIEENTAKSAGLKTAIAASIAAYESDKASLADTTALREKEVADFQQTELDLTKYIKQLGAAIMTLSDHASAALPQMPISFLQTRNIEDDLQWGMESAASRSLDAMMENSGLTESDDTTPAPSRQQEQRPRFLQADAPHAKTLTYHDFAPGAIASGQSWSSADIATLRTGLHAASAFLQTKHQDATSLESTESSEVLGIMKQLKEDMIQDLAEARKTESAASASFEKLRKSKTEEIEGDLQSKEDQEDSKAETDNSLADDKDELANTEKTLSEDEAFLSKVSAKCDEEMAAYTRRQADRDEEITALNEAMEELGVEPNATIKSDDRGTGLGSNESTSFISFVQVSSKTRSHTKARSKAAQLLQSAARRSNDFELSMLATSMHTRGLELVEKEIDKMVDQLKKNQQADVDENDLCKDKLGTAALDIGKLEQELDENSKASEKAKADLKEKGEKYNKAEQSIVSLRESLLQASIARKSEHAAFKNTVADTSFTLEFLIKAIYRLARFYDKKSSLLQTQRQKPMPAGKPYKAQKGKAVIELLAKVINDAQKVMKEASNDEYEAAKTFEALKADTEESIKLAGEAMTSLKAKKAALQKTLNTLKADHMSTGAQLSATQTFQKSTADECGDLMNNFDATQQARQSEIEALQQTKQILRGASFD